MGLAVSVAQRSGREGLGFRPGETETGFAWAGTRGQGAGRWWQGVDGIVSCRFGCRARLGSGLVHGNALRALRVLGYVAVLTWRGHGDADGLDHWQPLWGIGHWGRGRAGGEVTAQTAVGGALSTRGCPRWAWRRAGQRGVLLACLCGVGSW
jgi:hypothetical protein